MTALIADVFARLRADHRTGLVTYVTGGDPDAARSADILRGLDRAGADILEVGVPFSDPLADGPVIQRASERALAGGATLSSTLDLIERVRADVRAAVVVFSYVNPIFKMGTDAFAARHIEGAVNVPRGQLELRADKLLPNPGQRIVVYCQLGKISTLAAATLREMGFEAALALDGGFETWDDAKES